MDRMIRLLTLFIFLAHCSFAKQVELLAKPFTQMIILVHIPCGPKTQATYSGLLIDRVCPASRNM